MPWPWVMFIIGLSLGACIGMIIVAMLVIASDDHGRHMPPDYDSPKY